MVETSEMTSVGSASGADNAKNASQTNDQFDIEALCGPLNIPRFKWNHESEKMVRRLQWASLKESQQKLTNQPWSKNDACLGAITDAARGGRESLSAIH